MWFVPLSSVLAAHGLAHIRPYAFATSGVAAFVSPLLFGAVADRHASPVKVLRWLAIATAIAMALASTAIHLGAGPWVVLGLILLHAFCSSPTWSIASTIVFARLADAKKEFGPIRAMATLGWMGGCLLVSALGADQSTLAGYGGAVAWLAVSVFTFWLPALETPKAVEGLTWTQRLGYDALTLLRNRDHRVVFLTTAFFTIPLAAFYPYTPPNLKELGLVHTTAWMSLGQITEVIAMLVPTLLKVYLSELIVTSDPPLPTLPLGAALTRMLSSVQVLRFVLVAYAGTVQTFTTPALFATFKKSAPTKPPMRILSPTPNATPVVGKVVNRGLKLVAAVRVNKPPALRA